MRKHAPETSIQLTSPFFLLNILFFCRDTFGNNANSSWYSYADKKAEQQERFYSNVNSPCSIWRRGKMCRLKQQRGKCNPTAWIWLSVRKIRAPRKDKVAPEFRRTEVSSHIRCIRVGSDCIQTCICDVRKVFLGQNVGYSSFREWLLVLCIYNQDWFRSFTVLSVRNRKRKLKFKSQLRQL